MSDAAWRLLDLAPTSDEAAIRRAYARRLKQTRPDDDPEGFQTLLAARDRALAEARRRPPPPPSESPVEVLPAENPAAPDPAPALVVDVSPPSSEPAPAPVVRVSDPDPAPPAAELPLVIDVAPLEADRAQWQAAAALADRLPPLDRDAEGAFADWLAGVRRLPHEPRRGVEEALLHALLAAWRGPDGQPVARRIAATRPALLRAAPVFGWPREDAVIAASLPPRDAAVVVQVLRDALPPAPDDPATVLVRTGPWTCLPLQAGDARAFLDGHPHALRAYEAMLRRAPVARRVSAFALVAPHLWAVAYRRWGVALAALAGLWLSFGLCMVATDGDAGRGAAVAAGVAAVLAWAGTAGATAVWADRILVAGAARAARRAGRRGVCAPGERTARLRAAGTRLGAWNWIAIAWLASFPFVVPYVGLVSLAAHLTGR
ncbi:MAG: hypothetical protein PGN34_11630 [Methylobacterium frigidaeris]